MKQWKLFSEVRDGDLDWGERGFQEFTQTLKELDGKKVEIIVREVPKNKYRTLEQNAYLFGVVYRYFSEKTGYTKDETHELLKQKFLGYDEEKALADEKFKISRSTASLGIDEMSAYINQCTNLYFDMFHETIPEPRYE